METTRKQVNGLGIGIILLGLVTAFIHLFLAFTSPLVTVIFTLNFLGYVSLLTAYTLRRGVFGRYHHLIRYAFIGFTALTIVLWVIMGERTPIAYVDKAAEVSLIVLLLLDH
jgi:hypothetical protein